MDESVRQFDGLFEATPFVGFENLFCGIAGLLGAEGFREKKGEGQGENLGGEEEGFHPRKTLKPARVFCQRNSWGMGTFPLPSWGHCGDDSLIDDLASA